ncbi:MAG TPA: diguanylate cyclase [Solidesulfovibrio magneticus]|nr:diguanylate cyclase [Solidesulfovibrio magneticus]
MDQSSLILSLAIGSFVFAGLLYIFQRNKPHEQRIPFWITAKCLQGAGSLCLYFLSPTPPGFPIVAAPLLLTGCAYECWALFAICGHPVSRRTHLWTAGIILVLTLAGAGLDPQWRMVMMPALHAVFYGLPAWALLANQQRELSLRVVLGGCFVLLAAVFAAQSALALCGLAPVAPLDAVVPTAVYVMLLVSGFSLLLLAQQKSDDELELARRSFREQDAQYRFIVDNALEGIVALDKDSRVTFLNRRMAEMVGYPVEEVLGRPYLDFLTEDQFEDAATKLAERSRGLDGVYERCLLRRDGSRKWVQISARAVLDAAGNYAGAFSVITDIDARKKTETALAESNKRLAEQSLMDGLTGIANRRRFDEALAREYRRHARGGAPLSLIFIDIDHFKAFNDCYGHIHGDACLRQVAGVLRQNVTRAGDLVARYGGEEFACILAETDATAAAAMAERLRQAVAALDIPHEASPTACRVTVSCGAATARCLPGGAPLDLLARADGQLYRAKAAGRDQAAAEQCPA